MELIAANHTVEKHEKSSVRISLTYLSIGGLIDSIGIDTDGTKRYLCVAYFDGKYPTPLYDYEERYWKLERTLFSWESKLEEKKSKNYV